MSGSRWKRTVDVCGCWIEHVGSHVFNGVQLNELHRLKKGRISMIHMFFELGIYALIYGVEYSSLVYVSDGKIRI